MQTLRLLPLALLSLLTLPACTGEAGASGNPSGIAGELTKVLTGVTDTKTAEQAKERVTSLTTQLEKAVESAKAAVAGAAEKAKEIGGTDLGKMAGDLAGKAGEWLTPELKTAFSSVTTQVDRLLANPEIKNVLGTALEKLKGLVGGAG